MGFECSSEEDKCDKGIARIKSCRECIFNVLCKFNPYYKKKNDREEKNTMGNLDEGNGLPETSVTL